MGFHKSSEANLKFFESSSWTSDSPMVHKHSEQGCIGSYDRL